MNSSSHTKQSGYIAKSGREGLIKTILTIIVGVLALSFIGFDLREKVENFEQEYTNEISAVTEFFNSVIKPGTEQVIDSSQDTLEDLNINESTIDQFIQFLKEIQAGIAPETYTNGT